MSQVVGQRTEYARTERTDLGVSRYDLVWTLTIV